jgi:hypothetical protein
MQRNYFIGLVFMLAFQQGFAQNDLFMSRNIAGAYEKETRSIDGSPGPKYWQNRAEYKIEINLEPKKRLVEGTETVTYYNNSPDTLRMIRIKLAHDLYKKGGQRNDEVNPEDVDDGTEIKSVSLNGKTIDDKDQRRNTTFLDLMLRNSNVPPKSSVVLKIAWSYTMPADKGATRECVCDKSTFFVAYSYPQIAVYDDLQGWASAPYNGLQEFYNDFSDYDVTITAPKGYMVWATGEWQNPIEILQPAVFEKWNKAHTDSEVSSIFTEKELDNGDVFKKLKKHIFKYKAVNVPDFTFAASDHYNWDALSVVVDDQTGRRTFVSAAYDSKSADFYKVARIAADGIRLMSTWLPGYPFPYPCMTVFNGNDGMEYPMMVNDASTGQYDPTGLTVHEVSHTYFPFMMGINEQHYAWMDEGWASFFDMQLEDSLRNNKTGGVRGYGYMAGRESDVPPMTLSRFLSGGAYGIASYQRPQAAYLGLLDLLGYDKFHQCMTAYMNRWKGKHPEPYDFFYTWNTVSGQNLNWYWKPWFFEWGYPDLALLGVVKNEAASCDEISIRRKGNLPVAVFLSITYTDGTQTTEHRSADVWKDGKTELRIKGISGKKIKSATLGDRTVPDSNVKNNNWGE